MSSSASGEMVAAPRDVNNIVLSTICSGSGNISIDQLLLLSENRLAALERRACGANEASGLITSEIPSTAVRGQMRLATLNAHWRDERITLVEETHTY